MTTRYSVERNEFGVVIRGKIPVDELHALTKIWVKQGHDHIWPAITNHLGATMAIASHDRAAEWTKALGLKEPDDGR